jgi:hypothetical protein
VGKIEIVEISRSKRETLKDFRGVEEVLEGS